ncbi:MAG TPA: hypothetical protein VHY08_06435, partial [Bacillota bacterium]|nr:hypothetical protein [Bacillota bacterium]
NAAINTGYYTLLVYLYDGTSFKWGAAEAVRILAGQTSEGNYPIIPGAGFGGINLIITPDLQNPIGISFNGQQDQLLIGSGMTITATTSETVETYQWYLNGWPLSGETNSAITIGSSLGQGVYRLDLIVTKGNISSSETVNFRISQFAKNQKITLNFDTMNTLESGTCPISNEFQAFGVIFSSVNLGTSESNPAVVIKDRLWGNGAVSLPNSVSINNGKVTRIVFVDPITGNPGVTNFVSAMVGDQSSEADPVTMTAYDINNKVLGTCSFTSQPTNTLGVNDFGLVSLSVEGIHTIEFKDASPSGADFDDLTFTIPNSL